MEPPAWRRLLRGELDRLPRFQPAAAPASVRLDRLESPFPPPPALLEALASRVRELPLHQYPDAQAAELRAVVARDLGQPPERLVLGNGADELLTLLCAAFAAPRSAGPASVVYPAPHFVGFPRAAASAGLQVHTAPLGPRFEPDAEALSRRVAEVRPNLVLLTTPNNPTGTVWPRAAAQALLAAHPDVLWVLDQVYVDFGGEDLLGLLESADNCVVVRSYSKVGLAGLRLGVVVAREALAAELDKARPNFNLGHLTQLAATLALRDFRDVFAERVRVLRAERERLAAALRAIEGVEVFPSAANFLLLRVREAPRVWRALLEQSVLIGNLDRPGPLAGCLRVAIGTPEDNDRFLAALPRALAARPDE